MLFVKLNYDDIVAISKSTTELAIQNGLIVPVADDTEATAKEVAKFYRTVADLLADSKNS